jgi:hypothetical protein
MALATIAFNVECHVRRAVMIRMFQSARSAALNCHSDDRYLMVLHYLQVEDSISDDGLIIIIDRDRELGIVSLLHASEIIGSIILIVES